MNSYLAPPHDTLTYLGMVTITCAVVPVAAWVFSAGRWAALWRWLLAAGVVMALNAGLAASGLLARADLRPPLALLVMAVVLPTALVLTVRAASQPGASGVSLASLVLLQAFRLPLELLMLHAAQAGVMPAVFSLAGYNPDVTTGASALLLGAWLWRGRRVPLGWLWAWNLWGIACLLNIAVLAVLTAPNVAVFGPGPHQASLWVLRFPYVWLPSVLVTTAACGHAWLTVRLLARAADQPARHFTGSASRSA